ncbi:hypothetical protein [Halococcus sp. IIIV-5B]|uniref:hypothetical protein n=1 Tax=Halococcus sp. IIIV-5B TaxID=2321230 RepID=UPI0018F72312|nr:hypothetical protein [Halococcus sp. IIIV-5B]
MGLKSGSRDAGLDGSQEEDDQETETETVSRDEENIGTSGNQGNDSTQATEATSNPKRLTRESIPYKLRREKVNAGREQVPFFLRDEVVEAESDLQDALEEMVGENVYKSDYREAAMVVAQRNPKLVAEILREWGYDLDAT